MPLYLGSNRVAIAKPSSGSSGGGSVTQDQNGYIILPPTSGGGGSSNIIIGTFTTGSVGGVETVALAYTGNGYPLSIGIYPNEGAYNSSETAYNTIKQYAVVSFFGAKNIANSQPVYGTNNSADAFSTFARYKNSAEYSGNTSVSNSTANYFLVDTDPLTNASGCVKINSSNQLKYIVIGDTGYGLLPNTKYNYCIEFSK